MRKWTIKQKIIFWYTIVFVVVIGLQLYLFYTTSNTVLKQQATSQLITSVEEINASIEVEDDGINVELEDENERFSFVHDGVLFLIYRNNQLLYGQVPTGFDETTIISLGEVQSFDQGTNSYLVYDVAYNSEYTVRGLYDTEFITSALSEVFLTIGIVTPVMLVLASIGSYFIIKKTFKPINNIYQIASDIKNEEDYSKRIPLQYAKDEVYDLADMVNQMLDKVENAITREKQFSSNVSHELRTPITVMYSQVEYLRDKSKNKKDIDDLNSILRQISFLKNIVTQLLELTRTKQIVSDEKEVININDLVMHSVNSFKALMYEHHITLHLDLPEQDYYVYVHQTLMIRVFSNLIKNAIKYNKNPGEIRIHLSCKKDEIEIHISDTGIGLDDHQINKIFDPFYRVDESRTQSESLGLGLAMVKEIIVIHNGSIQVESTKGIGSTFTVLLPLHKK